MSLEMMHSECLQLITIDDLTTGICSRCGKVIQNHELISVERQVDQTEKYTKTFQEISDSIVKLARGKKTTDYKETWKDGGLKGIFIKILIKYGRLRNLAWNKECAEVTAVENESIRDTLMDLAAYSIYGIICYDERNVDGINSERETLLEMQRAIKERLGKINGI